MLLARKSGRILTSLFPSTRWGSFTVGAAAATFGAALIRPLLVSAVRTGYNVAQVAGEAIEQAKAEAASIKREAATQPTAASADVAAELQRLREEVAALKAQIGRG